MALSTMQQGIVGGNNGLTVIVTVYLIWQGTDSYTRLYAASIYLTVFHRLIIIYYLYHYFGNIVRFKNLS